jgi:deoxyribose-phosphate aldolase
MTTNFADIIDHTNLKAEATPDEIDALVAEALQHGFASVCVNGRFVAQVSRGLAGSDVKACAVAGFPLGAMKPSVKAIEATAACKDGAWEIDFVASLPVLLAKDTATATDEFMQIVTAVRSVRPEVVVKVILETSALTKGVDDAEAEARIAAACEAAQRSGCDFVKTSTGFHPTGGATVEAVKLLRKHAGPMKVKASGGIRSRDDAQRMVDAGADRLGCSAGVQIVAGHTGTASY